MQDIAKKPFVLYAVCLTLLFLGWQVVWAFATPAFRTPDEPQHLNSIVRVAEERGSWPAPGTARLYRSTGQAAHEAGLISSESEDYSAISRTWPSLRHDNSFALQPVTPHDERTPVSVGALSAAVDQMTQHPPLYYAGGAAVFRVVGAQAWPWDRQVLLLRLYSILLTAPLVPCLVYSVRRMGFTRRTALVGSLGVFAVPQLVFITASVSNDALAIGAGALCVAATVGAMFGHGEWWRVVLAGCALGLLLWSKGTAIPMGLVVALAFLLNPRAGAVGRRVTQGLMAGGIALVGGGSGGPGTLRSTEPFNPKVCSSRRLREPMIAALLTS